MRPIPPKVWTLMIVEGRLLRAIDETANVMLFDALDQVQQAIKLFLEESRKEKGK